MGSGNWYGGREGVVSGHQSSMFSLAEVTNWTKREGSHFACPTISWLLLPGGGGVCYTFG